MSDPLTESKNLFSNLWPFNEKSILLFLLCVSALFLRALFSSSHPLVAPSVQPAELEKLVGLRRILSFKNLVHHNKMSLSLVEKQEEKSLPSESENDLANQQPQKITTDIMKKFISLLPSSYDFEIEKTIQRINDSGCKTVGLQFPEGLIMFGSVISEIIVNCCPIIKSNSQIIILGDVTYGACCIDDWNAKQLEIEFLVHYGHSCLVPIQHCIPHNVKQILYIFVEIRLDISHFVQTIWENREMIFSSSSSSNKIDLNFDNNSQKPTNCILVSTIQFVSSLRASARQLKKQWASNDKNEIMEFIVPQARPLSPGEILGCTSPRLDTSFNNVVICISDGRFHLESMMIQNPESAKKFFRYDPFLKKIFKEEFDNSSFMKEKKQLIQDTSNKMQQKTENSSQKVGIIFGTLGRQGSLPLLQRVTSLLKSRHIKYFIVGLSEIFPDKLKLFKNKDAVFWVQIACPRLSIDWGTFFDRPLLTPYEFFCLMEDINTSDGSIWRDDFYPMEHYSEKGGKWSTNYKEVGDIENLGAGIEQQSSNKGMVNDASFKTKEEKKEFLRRKMMEAKKANQK